MFLPVYQEKFVLNPNSEYIGYYLFDWLKNSDLYGNYTFHKSDGEEEKYKNKPGFSFYYNSFRPNVDIFMYSYPKNTELLFKFKAPLKIEIFLLFWWGCVLLWSVLAAIIVLNGEYTPKILLVPALMVVLSLVMTFCGHYFTSLYYRKRIRDRINEMIELNKI